MNRILLLFAHRENARLLADSLEPRYQAIIAESEAALDEPFDLCVVDGPALDRFGGRLQQTKEAAQPVFLPVLLVTSRQDVAAVARRSWHAIDELIVSPVEKVELQARTEILLRARRLSLDLLVRNEDLEAFIHSLSHDLRAPLRAIRGFATNLLDERLAMLDAQGRSDVERIVAAADQMRELIEALVRLCRVTRANLTLQRVSLQRCVESCIRNLASDVQARDALVRFDGGDGIVLVDPTLLKVALTNLITNAVKYVAPSVRPEVAVRISAVDGAFRVEIQDNGIGIAPENQQRIFAPFARLHSVEEYPGVGLGLSTVKKAVELFDGKVGVRSTPGSGSTFWIELKRGE